MTTVELPDPVTDLLRLVDDRAVDDAGGAVLRQLAAGHRPPDIIRTLLVPAQVQAGERWHRARWTVAHEHQATAIVDAALHQLSLAVPAPTGDRTAAVVCAQGDWHTTASRMAAELLRADGWQVMFLGGSMPTWDLANWLGDARPDALVVTCSMATYAPGVLPVATAATRNGIPVVAGGAGLGGDAHRASALGVRWAADVTGLTTALTAPAPAEPADLQRRLADRDQLDLRRDDIRDAALRSYGGPWPPPTDLRSWQLTRTVADLGLILDFLAAAVLVDDARVLTDFVDWLAVLLQSRGAPVEAVADGVAAVSSALPPECASAHRMLADAAEVAAGQRPPAGPTVAG